MIRLPKRMCDGRVVEHDFKRLFHTTPKENAEAILREGLKRREGCAMVFLSTEASSWRHKGAEGENEVTFIIDIDGLEGRFTDFLPDLDEVNYWGDIPADRIRTVEDFTKGYGL